MLDWITYIIITKNVCCIIFSNDFGMTSPSLNCSSNLPSFFYPNVLDILFLLMSWWNLLTCSSLTSPQFSEKLAKWLWRKWISFHFGTKLSIVPAISVLAHQLAACIPKKSLNHWHEKFPSSWFNIIHWFNEMRILDDQKTISY